MRQPSLSLAYCTNIWSHHQSPISRELVSLLGEDRFRLCLFEPVNEERLKQGWGSAAPDCNWIAGPPRSSRETDRLREIVCVADVAVMGACPREILAARVATGKLTFVMSERMWKDPFCRWRILDPRFLRWIWKFNRIANRKHVHYLSMGAHASEDVRRIGAYGDRLWTWAYFAEVAPHPPEARPAGRVRFLWAGRMLDWKRVDLLLEAVARVCQHPAFGQVDIVGTGPEKSRLMSLTKELNLGDTCVFHDSVPYEQAREMMRHADVYVLPSDRHEGWGVVANEAMSEGAVLVANEQAGAARVLVDHGRTGFLFKDGDVGALADILTMLLGDAEMRTRVSQAAWKDMQRLWHPRVGAERLVGLCEGLLGRSPMTNYADGPCRHEGVRRN
jgi:glycosyltransferase involved in cell wall biosynthesis